MTFEQLMETEVGLQDFITWFRKDTARDTMPGRKLLKTVCGDKVVKKKLGEVLAGLIAHALEEQFDEELARLAQVAKAADEDGDGMVTEEEMKKKYGTVTEIFDEETARLAQLAKAADLDGDGVVTAEELAAKYGSGGQEAAQIVELEGRLSNEQNLTEQQRMLLQRELAAAKARKEAKDAAAQAFQASQNGGPALTMLTDEEKARLMLQKHDQELKKVEAIKEAQKKENESVLEKQLAARKARRLKKQQEELASMQHGSISKEQLPEMEAHLEEFIQAAQADGTLDEEEQTAIDAMRNAIAVMKSALADGKVTAEEMARIELVKAESLALKEKAAD